jgi:hypothetical protein
MRLKSQFCHELLDVLGFMKIIALFGVTSGSPIGVVIYLELVHEQTTLRLQFCMRTSAIEHRAMNLTLVQSTMLVLLLIYFAFCIKTRNR